MAHASPRKFLAATATQGRIKRALSVEELDTKRVRLDPKHLPIESKMRKCQARAQKALPNDRQNIPLLETDQWHLGEERTEPESPRANPNTDSHDANHLLILPDAGLRMPSEQVAELRAEQESLEARLDLLQRKADRYTQSRLSMFVANLLVDLANMVFPNSADTSSTIRLQQTACANDQAKQLTKMGIPPKCWPHLRQLDKFIARRDVAAHETRLDFATLLTSPPIKGNETHYRWAEVFHFVYGATVEEVVQGNKIDGEELPEL